MSVVVIGMEMPECCLCCPLFAGNGCKATGKIFNDLFNVACRPDGCPLRPLPEGTWDLIDRKAFEAAMRERQHAAMKWRAEAETEENVTRADAVQSFLCEVKLTLDGIPTIIEAEGEQ